MNVFFKKSFHPRDRLDQKELGGGPRAAGATGLRILKIFLGLVLLGLLSWLLYFFLFKEALLIKHVYFTGDSLYEGQSYVESLGKEWEGKSYFSLDKKDLEKKILLIPSVKELRWQYSYPSGVKLNLKVETPLAILFKKGDTAEQEGMYINSDAEVFPSFDNVFLALPVLEGFSDSGLEDLMIFKIIKELAILESDRIDLYRYLSRIAKVERSEDFFDILVCSFVYRPCALLELDQFGEEKLEEVFLTWKAFKDYSEEETYQWAENLDFRSHGVVTGSS